MWPRNPHSSRRYRLKTKIKRLKKKKKKTDELVKEERSWYEKSLKILC